MSSFSKSQMRRKTKVTAKKRKMTTTQRTATRSERALDALRCPADAVLFCEQSDQPCRQRRWRMLCTRGGRPDSPRFS